MTDKKPLLPLLSVVLLLLAIAALYILYSRRRFLPSALPPPTLATPTSFSPQDSTVFHGRIDCLESTQSTAGKCLYGFYDQEDSAFLLEGLSQEALVDAGLAPFPQVTINGNVRQLSSDKNNAVGVITIVSIVATQ